jgi:hypothetical protein
VTAQELAAVVVPVATVTEDELTPLLAHFGVSVYPVQPDERTVRLSERSNVVCPIHLRELVPHRCRSCHFLAGGVA